MIFKGNSIMQIEDSLIEIPIGTMLNEIGNPTEDFRRTIEKLRITRTIDERQYKLAKRTLPYFVCSRFHPLIRRKENFVSIEYFVLDIDHLFRSDMDILQLKDQMRKDSRILSYFVSPSGDGIKVVFRLSMKCLDSGMFAAFYKLFAKEFGLKYNCMDAIDLKTFDVTRACFMSVDEDLHINLNANAVELDKYVNVNDGDVIIDELKEVEKLFESYKQSEVEKEELNEDVIQLIKERLNPKLAIIKEAKAYYVPAELDVMIPFLEQELLKFEMQLQEVSSIQYGKKMKISAGKYWAEINLFFGKRGYSIVKTTKSGSHSELGDLAVKVLQTIILS
jgi:hypothetical protein